MKQHIYNRQQEVAQARFVRRLTLLCALFGITLTGYEPVELDEQAIREGRR